MKNGEPPINLRYACWKFSVLQSKLIRFRFLYRCRKVCRPNQAVLLSNESWKRAWKLPRWMDWGWKYDGSLLALEQYLRSERVQCMGTSAIEIWVVTRCCERIAYWGKLDVYSGSGYVQHLGGTRSQARRVLATLRDNLWIDRQ